MTLEHSVRQNEHARQEEPALKRKPKLGAGTDWQTLSNG